MFDELVQFARLQAGALQQPAAVEPQQVGALRRRRLDPRDPGEPGHDVLAGLRDVLAQLIQPGVPALVGGAAGRQAQRVGLGVSQRVQLGPEAGAQTGVGDEDIGDLQPRQVEGL